MPDPEGPRTEEVIGENTGLSIDRPGEPQEEPQEDPGLSKGLSSEDLPEEYKPYQNYVPWEKIPQEARDETLKGLKHFHGELTKGAQEVASLKEKERFLDYLYQQPEIQSALQQMQGRGNGQAQGPQQSSPQSSGLEKLSEYGFDGDVSKVLQETIQNQVSQALNPLTSQIGNLQQQIANREVQDQLSALKSMAKEKGLPDPNSKLAEMREIVSVKRASNVEDAYFLAIQSDLPSIYAERAKKEFQDKMQSKADKTMAPGFAPQGAPTNRLFTGTDAIENALKASEQELGIKF